MIFKSRNILLLAAAAWVLTVSHPADAVGLRIVARANPAVVREGGIATVHATLMPVKKGGKPNVSGIQLWPYLNHMQWGAPETTDARGRARFRLPLPQTGDAQIQISPQAPAKPLFPVGQALSRGAMTSNALSVRVARRSLMAVKARRHLVGIDYEPWFTPLNATWSTAEAMPLCGNYASANTQVIRQHALWLDEMGINYIVVDWSNNLWGKTHWNQHPPGVDQLVAATDALFNTYAQMRKQGLPTPQITLLLGLINGPPTTTTAVNEEMDYVRNRYLRNARYHGLWLRDHHKPLILIFNGLGPAFTAGKPPIHRNVFAVRWMASQLQATPAIATAGYWSWMDGSVHPIPTPHRGRVASLTVTPACFDNAGWLGKKAHGRDGGRTYMAELRWALRQRPKFLNICQWNEFAGPAKQLRHGKTVPRVMDCYNIPLSNDIEPTTRHSCAYRGCGGWGFYYANITRAFVTIYRQKKPTTTLLAITSPAPGKLVKAHLALTVRWSRLGKRPTGYRLKLDGRALGGPLGASAKKFVVPTKDISPGRHTLIVYGIGAESNFRLSFTHMAHPLGHAAPAESRVMFTVR